MNRLGPRRPTLCEFGEFSQGLRKHAPVLSGLRNMSTQDLTQDHWAALQNFYENLTPMRGMPRLVGNSKVLAHLTPNLAAPVDRAYKLPFKGTRPANTY